MCGIAGIWDPFHKLSGADVTIEAMAKRIIHRGPDGMGFHKDSASGLFMGHTRLSIIDLNTGEQPLFSQNKKQILTANGEFYDYKYHRGYLTTKGHQFSTKSDSELALKFYQEHGLNFVNSLRGEFAFALFDHEQEQLILVRDRFGIRPLFFHIRQDQSLFYASEIKSLLASPDVPQELSPTDMLHQMMQVTLPGHTLFKNIHSLKPGHMLIIKKGSQSLHVEEKCYWDADFPEHGQHSQYSDEEHIEMVQEALLESIALRLEADVPVACYLSGGIDSCSILGLASAIQQSPVKGFTISFDDDRYDEAAIATEMAHQCGASQDILEVHAADLYGKNFEKALYHSERTFYNTLGVSKLLMSQHVTQSGFKVVITGEGSDEIFGGYTAFKQDMFLHDPLYQKSGLGEKLLKDNAVFSGSILAEQSIQHPAFEKLCGFTPSWIQPWILTLKQVYPLLSQEFTEQLKGYDPIEAIAMSMDASKLKGRHPLDQAQYTWIKTMLEGQILNWGGDRVDMANSLESRPAFLDHHVVEMAIKLPPNIRIREGVEKWVLREAMKHILPKTLYTREKFSFMAPPAHTDKAKQFAIGELIHKYLSDDTLKHVGMIDPQKHKEFIQHHHGLQNHTQLTRYDIILNHLIGVHALKPLLSQGGVE